MFKINRIAAVIAIVAVAAGAVDWSASVLAGDGCNRDGCAPVLTGVNSGQIATSASEASELNQKIRRFAPTVMTANTARLAPNDRKALQKIIAAAKLYDALYMRQIWSGNESLWKKLEGDKTPLGG